MNDQDERRTLEALVKEVLDILKLVEIQAMSVDQKILDAEARLAASVSALNAKVDALLAASSNPADTQQVVDAINAQADAVDAEAVKLP